MELIERVIKNEIKALRRIKDTFDERYQYLRLDKNERLLPFDEKKFETFKNSLTFDDFSGYGELGAVYRKLAAFLGVSENQVLLASGSDLAIKSVYEACVDNTSSVVLHAPSYAMYKIYAMMFGAEIIAIPVKPDWQTDIDGMLRAVKSSTKLLALENPNGFVGTAPTRDEIKYVAGELLKKNVLLLLDEAYYYVENSKSASCELIREYPNLVISQTLSKAHGLAGARVGYLVGDAEVIEYISRVRPMHEVTSLTALAAIWLLDHPEEHDTFLKSIVESKKILKQGLSRLDINFKDTHANFIMMYCPDAGRTQGLQAKFKAKGILVRRPFEESYLKGWMRVCVGTELDSERFVTTFEELVS